MVDLLCDFLDLGFIKGIVAADGGHQLRHQYVIDLFNFHALEGEMKSTNHLGQRPLC